MAAGASRQRPCSGPQTLGLRARRVGRSRVLGIGLVCPRDAARRADEAARPAGRERRGEILTRPPCAPMPGSRKGAAGMSSRRRARCSGTVAPATAPTSAMPARPARRARRRSPRGAPGPSPSPRAGPGRRRHPGSRCARGRTSRRRSRGRRRRTLRASRGPARVHRDGVAAQALDLAERRRRRGQQPLGVGRGGDVDVAALGVGITSSPASRAWATIAASAVQPGAPRRSKQASCGLHATHAGAAASMSAAQCAVTAAAASSAGVPDAGTAPAASGHRRAGSGSIPRTIWLSRAATWAARRSPKLIGATLAAGSAPGGASVASARALTRGPGELRPCVDRASWRRRAAPGAAGRAGLTQPRREPRQRTSSSTSTAYDAVNVAPRCEHPSSPPPQTDPRSIRHDVVVPLAASPG